MSEDWRKEKQTYVRIADVSGWIFLAACTVLFAAAQIAIWTDATEFAARLAWSSGLVAIFSFIVAMVCTGTAEHVEKTAKGDQP